MNAGVEQNEETRRPGNSRRRSLLERAVFLVGVTALTVSIVGGFAEGIARSDGPPFGTLIYRHVARRYLAEGRYDLAAAEFRGDQRVNPMEPMPTLNLAGVLRRQGDVEGALEVLRIGANRTFDPVILFPYARALAETGRDAEAEQAVLQAVAADPSDPESHLKVGKFYARRGRLAEAAESYEAALEVDPSLTEARHELYRMRDLMRERAESERLTHEAEQ